MSRFQICCLLVVIFKSSLYADDWPQWRGPNRDGVWRETGIVETFAAPQLTPRWRVPISSGYSGPTVAEGRVYVTDRVVEPTQVERIHCFDEQSGKSLWTHTYDCTYSDVGYQAGPRASVLIDEGRAYALGTMGDLFCLDAKDGNVLWRHDCRREYQIRMPIWGIAASPLMERDLLIVQIGGAGACIVAFDKRSGQEAWRALNDRACYSAPIVIEQAGLRVVVCWTGDSVVGLDPATGKVHWQHPFRPNKMPIAISTPVLEQGRLFFTAFYDGSLMLKVLQDKPAVEVLWRRQGSSELDTDALHSIIATPYLEGDYVYGVDSYGELRCLDAKTGDRLWESLEATPRNRWSNIHMVKNGSRMFLFNERGELIIAKLLPTGYVEISRTKLIEPTTGQLPRRDGVCWSHPAYANKHVYIRNDKELLSANLAADGVSN